MGTVVITPCSEDVNGSGAVVPIDGAEESLTIGTGASVISAAMPAGATLVNLRSDADCYVRVGNPPTAATSADPFLPTNVSQTLGIAAGDQLHILEAS